MSTDPQFTQYVSVNVVKDGLDDPAAPKVEKGNAITVHYTGKLNDANGKQFDSSLDRGTPLGFTAGKGQVIKGWDEGLLGTRLGEERNLTIKPEWAYKDKAVGGDLIPANSTLYFECKLVSIEGKTEADFKKK